VSCAKDLFDSYLMRHFIVDTSIISLRLSDNHADKQLMLHCLAKEKCTHFVHNSMISDVPDVMLMMVQLSKFV